jgi:tetratricopeptide (TPR) repeat protein
MFQKNVLPLILLHTLLLPAFSVFAQIPAPPPPTRDEEGTIKTWDMDVRYPNWREQREAARKKENAQNALVNEYTKKKNASNLNKKGNQAYKSGNWKQAINYYKNALKKSPNDRIIKKNLINAQNALNKEYAKKKNASSLNKKGNQAYKSKNWKQAVSYYKNALKNSPNNRVIKQNLIYAQKALSKEYTKKRNASALNKKGNLAYNSKNWKQAIDYYKKALKNSPNNRVIKQNLRYAKNALAKQAQKKKLAAEQRKKIKEQKDKVLKLTKRFAAVSAKVNLPASANADANEAICEQNKLFVEIMSSNAITPEEKRKYRLKLPILNKNVVPPLNMSTQASASIHESFFTENLSMDQYIGSNLRGLDKAFCIFKEVIEISEEQAKSKTIDFLIGSIRNPRMATALKGGRIVSNTAFDAINNFMESAMKAVGGHHDSKQFWKDIQPSLMQKEKKVKIWTWRRK